MEFHSSDKTTEYHLMQSCGGSFIIRLYQRQAPFYLYDIIQIRDDGG